MYDLAGKHYLSEPLGDVSVSPFAIICAYESQVKSGQNRDLNQVHLQD